MSDHEPHSATDASGSDVAHGFGPITRVGNAPPPGDDHTSDVHSADAHGGIGQYMLVFLALCGLTTMSFFTCSSYWPWRDQPQVGWAFMMGGQLEIRADDPCRHDGDFSLSDACA